MKVLELNRRTKGLSQAELAERILYSRSVISRLESGTLSPQDVHPRLRKALESYFNKPLEELLRPVEPASVHLGQLPQT